MQNFEIIKKVFNELNQISNVKYSINETIKYRRLHFLIKYYFRGTRSDNYKATEDNNIIIRNKLYNYILGG